MDKRSRRGTIPYFIVLAISAALFVYAGSITSMGGADRAIGPSFWPRLVLVLTMCVCVFELVFRWFFDMQGASGLLSQVEQQMEGEGGAQADSGGSADEPEERNLRQLLIGTGLTLAYVWSLPLLGFAVASAVFIALFIWLGTYRRAKVVAAVSLLGTLLLMFIFMKVVYVSLPLGVKPFESVSLLLMGLLGIR